MSAFLKTCLRNLRCACTGLSDKICSIYKLEFEVMAQCRKLTLLSKIRFCVLFLTYMSWKQVVYSHGISDDVEKNLTHVMNKKLRQSCCHSNKKVGKFVICKIEVYTCKILSSSVGTCNFERPLLFTQMLLSGLVWQPWMLLLKWNCNKTVKADLLFSISYNH